MCIRSVKSTSVEAPQLLTAPWECSQCVGGSTARGGGPALTSIRYTMQVSSAMTTTVFVTLF